MGRLVYLEADLTTYAVVSTCSYEILARHIPIEKVRASFRNMMPNVAETLDGIVVPTPEHATAGYKNRGEEPFDPVPGLDMYVRDFSMSFKDRTFLEECAKKRNAGA